MVHVSIDLFLLPAQYSPHIKTRAWRSHQPASTRHGGLPETGIWPRDRQTFADAPALRSGRASWPNEPNTPSTSIAAGCWPRQPPQQRPPLCRLRARPPEPLPPNLGQGRQRLLSRSSPAQTLGGCEKFLSGIACVKNLGFLAYPLSRNFAG